MKKYELIWDDEKMCLTRTNDGFNSLELLGLLEITISSIKEQMTGNDTKAIKTIKRQIKNK
jgi:hypothetical protein